MVLPSSIQRIIDDLTHHEEVEAIFLAGSRGRSRTPDVASDYDLYLYLTKELPVAARRKVLEPKTSVLELDHRFWETEDDGILNDGTPFELIYRDLASTTSQLVRVVDQHQAAVGYTTCLWDNVVDGYLIFDRQGRGASLQKRFDVGYPPELARAIVAKNWPLLNEVTCSYRHQISQAVARRDWISAQHRSAALLASVFDLVFAANLARHPGEKRLLERSLLLPKLPTNFAKLVEGLAGPESLRADQILLRADALAMAVGDWLASLGFLPHRLARPVQQPVVTTSPTETKGALTVYTDGGCIGNPGKGAWAYLIDDGIAVIEASSGEKLTTNNRMELQAVIAALTAIASTSEWAGHAVVIHTDSQYVRNGITAWIKSWEANGWKTAAKEPVKNKELWIELQKWDKTVKPTWKWVKGHAGNPRNERCDALVRLTMDAL